MGDAAIVKEHLTSGTLDDADEVVVALMNTQNERKRLNAKMECVNTKDFSERPLTDELYLAMHDNIQRLLAQRCHGFCAP